MSAGQNASAATSQTIPPSSASLSSWPALLLIGFVSYICLCSLLRFKRIKSTRVRYGYTNRASLARMTNQDAHEIAKSLIYLEFPLFYDFSVRLALFETYTIENIAKLLIAVSDLNKWDALPKRYEDSEIIFSWYVYS
ncbi:hypothetical protein B0J13DRAFT_633265 [Dactylonectria estremocensis]|uniref:Uncharacterized protein n=1 Tax=Dactylonectria estremocensis TaxID=1079267 RepID=A0A9P9FGH4_9HYPO|nr:hypothetical protein B0J13DRAFT_633265 [Dactylonectria estremocensis]